MTRQTQPVGCINALCRKFVQWHWLFSEKTKTLVSQDSNQRLFLPFVCLGSLTHHLIDSTRMIQEVNRCISNTWEWLTWMSITIEVSYTCIALSTRWMWKFERINLVCWRYFCWRCKWMYKSQKKSTSSKVQRKIVVCYCNLNEPITHQCKKFYGLIISIVKCDITENLSVSDTVLAAAST